MGYQDVHTFAKDGTSILGYLFIAAIVLPILVLATMIGIFIIVILLVYYLWVEYSKAWRGRQRRGGHTYTGPKHRM